MSESEIIYGIIVAAAPPLIWAVTVIHVVSELLEQRRRETKTGEFGDKIDPQ